MVRLSLSSPKKLTKPCSLRQEPIELGFFGLGKIRTLGCSSSSSSIPLSFQLQYPVFSPHGLAQPHLGLSRPLAPCRRLNRDDAFLGARCAGLDSVPFR